MVLAFTFIIGGITGILIQYIIIDKKDKKNISKHYYQKDDACYEDGKITNLCAIIAIKNIKRELKNQLSPLEKDALDKGVESIISMEKLYNFIECGEQNEEH